MSQCTRCDKEVPEDRRARIAHLVEFHLMAPAHATREADEQGETPMAEETAPATKPCTACKRRDGTHAPSCYKSKAKGGQRRGKSPPAPPAMATVAAWLDEQIDSLKGELAYMERLKARV